MIEAPEAVNIAAQISRTLAGKKITTVIAGFTPHKFTFFTTDQAGFEKLLLGRTVDRALPVGGMVRMDAGDAHMAFTDGANLRYLGPGEELPAKHQFLLGFDDESCLVMSVRMYGGILAFEGEEYTERLSDYYDAARSKPQVLSDEFSEGYFMDMINSPDAQNKSSKAFLATGQAIPGLGNGVLQDILYNAGIHPKTKISALGEQQRRKLYAAVRSTLSEMAAAGGRSSETDIFGRPGGYVPYLSKDTLGQECVRCGDIIMKENYMGGAVYYCPGCQK